MKFTEIKMEIDADFVREIFDYDGRNLRWKVRLGRRAKVGSVAGYLHHDGYRYI